MAQRKQGNPNESTKACLTFEERPPTPEHIRKFRRSALMEPGKSNSRFDDAERLGLKDKSFGCGSDSSDVNAAQLINLSKTTLVQDIKLGKSEQIYQSVKREPLGKSYSRNYQLPPQCATEPFGVKSVSSLEPAKGIIFPTVTEDIDAGSDLYKKSHGSYAPGEQKSRSYTWRKPVDEMVFGLKGNIVAFNGVSQNVDDILKSRGEAANCVDTQFVEDHRRRGDILGQSRYLGQDSDKRGLNFAYGKPSFKSSGKGAKQNYGAAEVIRGRYTEEQQQADPDLGKSLTPGFRNIQDGSRVYGCPSIRDDIPKISLSRRSIADAQNYGDDATAAELVNPSSYSNLVIDSSVFGEMKSKKELVALFKKIGFGQVHDDIYDKIFAESAAQCGSEDSASIEVFRGFLNVYLESIDTGKEEQWLEEHGLI